MDDKAGGEVFSQDKIFAHVDELSKWLNSDPHSLVTVELDPTNICQSNCPHCTGGRSSDASLSRGQLMGIVIQLANYGVKAITFTGGGSPLLNPHTLDAVELTKKMGLDVGFITNGITVSREAVKTLVKCCVWCRISLDAGTKEMYLKTHGIDGKIFNNVVRNTRRLVKEKKETKSKVTLGTAYLTGRDTVDGILDFVKLSKKIGVDYAQLRPFHNDTTNIEDELRKAKSYENEHFKVLASSHKYNLFGEEKRPYDKCYGCNFLAVVTSDFELTCCCHTRGISKFTLGDLNKQSFEEIWNSEKRKKLFDSIDPHKCIPWCRADSVNRILWGIKRLSLTRQKQLLKRLEQLNQKHPQTHENFL